MKLQPMKPKKQATLLLGVTRSKAKMYEYAVPQEHHISVTKDLAAIMDITIGILGDESVRQAQDSFTEIEDEDKKSLLFAARYFDSFVESRWKPEINEYFLLIGAAAYYLSDVPGNAIVLARRLQLLSERFRSGGISSLLLWVLKKDFYNRPLELNEYRYAPSLDVISTSLRIFFNNGGSEATLRAELSSLREFIYSSGDARELLLIDLTNAVLRKLINTSSRKSLAAYSNVESSLWTPVITKESFVREFWPSQIRIGKKDVYNGKSAIIQMPTSAGKTRATEIIIRSSFLSQRSDFAVVVAPFRALCNEIKLDLSRSFEGEDVYVDIPADTFQVDFDEILNFNFSSQRLVLVLTPEKFLYMLRHAPELGTKIGLLIYDEGHQFDNGLRGVTYELLLASLKDVLPSNVQVVLISAVISNADLIGNWLIGNDKEIVSTTGLLSTYRSIAFASWMDTLGRLEFIDQSSPNKREFFVPRVLEAIQLNNKGKEKNARFFPTKEDSNSIALYLAMTLSKNGGVAIFCGSKLSVGTICDLAVDVYKRAYNTIPPPAEHSDTPEIKKLKYLHIQHYGNDHKLTLCCDLGVFTHSGSTPEGIRHSVEYAIKTEKIKVVVCTSTLAQGVNLPLRYLLVTSTNQSGNEIKTRDFHNLIGRAGRSGIYTEGSIIFTNPNIYDQRNNDTNRWRWNKTIDLLDPDNSEPCASTLLSIFEPIQIKKLGTAQLNPTELADAYFNGAAAINILKTKVVNAFSDPTSAQSEVSRQLSDKIKIICAIESYLMSHSNLHDSDDSQIEKLARGTLAYFLANEKGDTDLKENIVSLFETLSEHVVAKITDPVKRKRLGKTLLGVRELLDIEKWASDNAEQFKKIGTEDDMLFFIWPIIQEKISSPLVNKLTPSNVLIDLAFNWTLGVPYSELLLQLSGNNVKISAGSQMRNVTQEQVIDICDIGFSFEATLIIAALYEIYSIRNGDEFENQLGILNSLQKRIKYGLPDERTILLYEIGFADRALVQELAEAADGAFDSRRTLGKYIAQNPESLNEILNKYPSYFEHVLKNILTEFRF